jgi:pseudaminic acid synthase
MTKQEPHITIAGRKLGRDYPCFIIAEISANHHQNFDEAVELIKAAKSAGADAVKLQTYTPDTMTINSDKKWFQVGGDNNPNSWKGMTLYGLYKTAYTPWKWQPKLKKIADDLGILLFSTPFDSTAVDFLEKMNVACYKISSYETLDVPLLKKVSKMKKPVIISTGYDSFDEVALAITTLNKSGVKDVAVLHCVTSYADTPNPTEINLRTMADIREKFDVVSGFSDNNGGVEIPIIAAIYGAAIIEKHFILSRKDGGPDTQFSIEPKELKEMIGRIRYAESVKGKVIYGPKNETEAYNQRYRRSIFVSKDIKKGEKITKDNIKVVRPHEGLAPRHWDEVLGRVVLTDVAKGTPLSPDLIKN